MNKNTNERRLDEIVSAVEPSSRIFFESAQKRWDSLAKPLGALGVLETDVCTLASCAQSLFPKIDRRVLAVFCADNGIVSEGVSQSGQDVTTAVVKSLCDGKSSACTIARSVRCEVVPVDIGVSQKVSSKNLVSLCVRRGTRNFLEEDAMSREECAHAILHGIDLADKLSKDFDILLAGEMGIGNTTTSSALLSVFLSLDPKETTGKGAGLSDSALFHKIDVIRRGIERRKPQKDDALDSLSKLGGFDIAGMAGFFIGAAKNNHAAIVDGLIAQCAAIVAVKICPAVRSFLIASHESAEKASVAALSFLNLDAAIHAQFHLGEGTGALSLLPLLDLALEAYKSLPSFEKIGIEPYKAL